MISWQDSQFPLIICLLNGFDHV